MLRISISCIASLVYYVKTIAMANTNVKVTNRGKELIQTYGTTYDEGRFILHLRISTIR